MIIQWEPNAGLGSGPASAREVVGWGWAGPNDFMLFNLLTDCGFAVLKELLRSVLWLRGYNRGKV